MLWLIVYADGPDNRSIGVETVREAGPRAVGIHMDRAESTNSHPIQVYDNIKTTADYDISVLSLEPSGLIPVDSVTMEATVYNGGGVPTTGTPITLTIYDTLSSSVVFTDTKTVPIGVGATVTVQFEPFMPEPRRVYMAEVVVAEPMDTVHYNDTLRTIVRTALAFGDVVESWDFPDLGDGTGYSFAGITYAPDSGKFYVVSMNPRSTVFEFDPNDPPNTFTQTSWTLHSFFGTNDLPWGIAYGDGGFYVSHVGQDGSTFVGSYIGYYDGTGNLYDSLNVYTNIETGGWMAGLDWDAGNNYLWGVYVSVNGSNNIYKIDVDSKAAMGIFPNPTGTSLRGIAVFVETGKVFYGGWNQDTIYLVDLAGNIEDKAPMMNMADVDIWFPCNDPDEHIYAFVTLNNETNTLVKMATGFYCGQVSTAERTGASRSQDIRLSINGRTIFLNVDDPAVIYDVSGRMVARFSSSFTFHRPGLYIVRVKNASFKVIIR